MEHPPVLCEEGGSFAYKEANLNLPIIPSEKSGEALRWMEVGLSDF